MTTINITGRISKVAIFPTKQEGVSVARITVATSNPRNKTRDENGKLVPKTVFLETTMFVRNTGFLKMLNDYLRVGQFITASGYFDTGYATKENPYPAPVVVIDPDTLDLFQATNSKGAQPVYYDFDRKEVSYGQFSTLIVERLNFTPEGVEEIRKGLNEDDFLDEFFRETVASEEFPIDFDLEKSPWD